MEFQWEEWYPLENEAARGEKRHADEGDGQNEADGESNQRRNQAHGDGAARAFVIERLPHGNHRRHDQPDPHDESKDRADDRDEMSEHSLEVLALYEIDECKRIVRLQLLVVLAVLAVTLVGVGAAVLATELPWGHSVSSAPVAGLSTR